MDYTLDYLSDEKIIRVKMKGRLNFQIAEQFSREAVKLARQNDCNKFLLDHTETNMSGGVNKIHTSGEELQEFGFRNTDKIAIVISNYDVNSSLLEPGSYNSRWSSFKYFSADNIQEAHNWLLEIN
jgi:hypothetical protein